MKERSQTNKNKVNLVAVFYAAYLFSFFLHQDHNVVLMTRYRYNVVINLVWLNIESKIVQLHRHVLDIPWKKI